MEMVYHYSPGSRKREKPFDKIGDEFIVDGKRWTVLRFVDGFQGNRVICDVL